MKDKKLYSVEHVSDPIQDRLDYLNLGIVEIRKFIDFDLYLSETLEEDEKVLKDYQDLGVAYCISIDDNYEILRKSMIANYVALPTLIKDNKLRDSFNSVIFKSNTKLSTEADCYRLFTSTNSKDQYIKLVNNYESYYLYDDRLPDGITNIKQNKLDYLNLGEIDSKRFIYNIE